MSEGLATALKMLAAAVVVVIITLVLTDNIPNWILDAFTWFKGQIGM